MSGLSHWKSSKGFLECILNRGRVIGLLLLLRRFIFQLKLGIKLYFKVLKSFVSKLLEVGSPRYEARIAASLALKELITPTHFVKSIRVAEMQQGL